MFLSELMYRLGVMQARREGRIIKAFKARATRIVGPLNVNGLVRIPNKIRKRCEGAKR